MLKTKQEELLVALILIKYHLTFIYDYIL